MNSNLHSLVFFIHTYIFFFKSKIYSDIVQLDTFQNCLYFKPHYRDVDCFSLVVSSFVLFFSFFSVLVLAKMPLAHPLDASAYRFYLWQRTLFIFIWIFTIIHLHLLDAGSDGSRRPHFIKCFYFENVLVFRWLPCICCAIWFTIEMRERKEEKKKRI